MFFFLIEKKKVTWPIMTRGPLVRWPTTVMVKPKRSRRNQIAHGKTKKLKAKPNSSRKNQKANDKTKQLTAKSKSARQNQIAHGKTKQLKKALGKTKKLTAKPNSSRKTKRLVEKPKDTWQNQKAQKWLRITLKTSVFYQHFQVRFFLPVLSKSTSF